MCNNYNQHGKCNYILRQWSKHFETIYWNYSNNVNLKYIYSSISLLDDDLLNIYFHNHSNNLSCIVKMWLCQKVQIMHDTLHDIFTMRMIDSWYCILIMFMSINYNFVWGSVSTLYHFINVSSKVPIAIIFAYFK